MGKECKEFNGHIYCRWPEAEQRHRQVYYWPSRTDRKKFGLEALHREIWKSLRGPIPAGMLIHHKDENPLNNDPDNLECVDRKQHGKRHSGPASEKLRAALDKIRGKASEWHRSPEGREWHRHHGKSSWEGRQPVQKTCVKCGASFETLANRDSVRFCSEGCRSYDYFHRSANTVHRQCPICGKEYDTSKYDPSLTCGKRCGQRWRQQNKP